MFYEWNLHFYKYFISWFSSIQTTNNKSILYVLGKWNMTKVVLCGQGWMICPHGHSLKVRIQNEPKPNDLTFCNFKAPTILASWLTGMEFCEHSGHRCLLQCHFIFSCAINEFVSYTRLRNRTTREVRDFPTPNCRFPPQYVLENAQHMTCSSFDS